MGIARRDREVPVCRMDTKWFPTQLSIEAQLRDGRWRGRLRAPRQDIELEGLQSVWYRSPTTLQFAPQFRSAERHHAFLEAKFGLGGVLSSLPVLWVNHPARAAAASKPVQLATAAPYGLTVPETLITNDAQAVRRFARRGATVTKMLGANHIAEEGIRKITFTRLLGDDDLDDLRGITATTHQFQRRVAKKYDAGGQFGWLEARTGVPLTGVLADLLAAGTQT